jgi:hypothetical protein
MRQPFFGGVGSVAVSSVVVSSAVVLLTLVGQARGQTPTPGPAATKPSPSAPAVATFSPADTDPRSGLFHYNNLMWQADTAAMAGRVAAATDDEKKLAAAMIRSDAQVGRLLALVRDRFGPDAAEDVATAIGDRTNAYLASAHTLVLNPDGSYRLTLASPPARPNQRTDLLDAYPSDMLNLSPETLAKLSVDERAKIELILSGKKGAATRPAATRASAASQGAIVADVTTPPSLTIPPRLDGGMWVVTLDGREARYEHRGQALALVLFVGSDQPSVLRQDGNVWKMDLADIAAIAPGLTRPLVDSFLKNANRAKVVYQELLSGQLTSAAEVSDRIESIK